MLAAWEAHRALEKSQGSESSDWKLKKERWPEKAVIILRVADIPEIRSGLLAAESIGSLDRMPVAIIVIIIAENMDRNAVGAG